MARELVSAKQELGEVSSNYEQLQVTMEMERGFQEAAAGTQNESIPSEDESDWAKQKAELLAQLQQATHQLSVTQGQLDAVHTSWQEQHQEIVDCREANEKLSKQLEDVEQRYRGVTESLALQTTELINERKEKRAFEEKLIAERQEHKEIKKQFNSIKVVKSEEAPKQV